MIISFSIFIVYVAFSKSKHGNQIPNPCHLIEIVSKNFFVILNDSLNSWKAYTFGYIIAPVRNSHMKFQVLDSLMIIQVEKKLTNESSWMSYMVVIRWCVCTYVSARVCVCVSHVFYMLLSWYVAIRNLLTKQIEHSSISAKGAPWTEQNRTLFAFSI